jgi:hypothetical protein
VLPYLAGATRRAESNARVRLGRYERPPGCLALGADAVGQRKSRSTAEDAELASVRTVADVPIRG